MFCNRHAFSRPRQVKILKVAVILMGVILLVGGFIAFVMYGHCSIRIAHILNE